MNWFTVHFSLCIRSLWKRHSATNPMEIRKHPMFLGSYHSFEKFHLDILQLYIFKSKVPYGGLPTSINFKVKSQAGYQWKSAFQISFILHLFPANVLGRVLNCCEVGSFLTFYFQVNQPFELPWTWSPHNFLVSNSRKNEHFHFIENYTSIGNVFW